MHTVVNTLTTNQITQSVAVSTKPVLSFRSLLQTHTLQMEPVQTTFTSNAFACTQQQRACSTIPFSSCLHNFHYILYYHPCIDCQVFLYHTDTNILIQTLHWYTFRLCFHIMLFNEDIPLHGFVGSVIIYKPA